MLSLQSVSLCTWGTTFWFTIKEILWCSTIVAHLEIFGTICYPTNLESKAWSGIFVGYQDQQLVGRRIYLPRSNGYFVSGHASFENHKARKSGFENGYTTDELNKPSASQVDSKSLQGNFLSNCVVDVTKKGLMRGQWLPLLLMLPESEFNLIVKLGIGSVVM